MTRSLARIRSRLVFASVALLAAAQALGGDLFVSSVGTDSVLRYNGATGAFVGTFTGAPAAFPEGVIFGPDGNLYVSGGVGDGVKRFNGSTGAFIDNFVPSHSGGLNGADGLTFGPDGNLYVVSFFTASVLRYNGSTGAFLGVFATHPALTFPEGLTFGPDGNLYVGSRGTASVLRFNGVTGAFISVFVPTASGGLSDPVELLFGHDGSLLVASEGTASVLRYNGTTGAFLGAFVASGSGGLFLPRGMAFGADANLYVADDVGAVLRYNGSTGAFIDTFVSLGSGGLSLATFLAFSDQTSPAGPGRFWIGLKNSDDVGTQFDLKTDVYVNSTLVGSGITRCIVGLTRNPDKARAVSPPSAFPPFEVGEDDIVRVKLSARIGTNPDDTKCSGPGGSHNSATGLRLYYDSISRASSIDLDFTVTDGDPTLYLHSNGGICVNAPSAGVTKRFLDTNPPDGTLTKCSDSAAVNFAGGNPWKEIGTWSLAP